MFFWILSSNTTCWNNFSWHCHQKNHQLFSRMSYPPWNQQFAPENEPLEVWRFLLETIIFRFYVSFLSIESWLFKSDPYAINLLWSPHWVGFHPLNNITIVGGWTNPFLPPGTEPKIPRRNSSQMPGRSWRKSWTSLWWIPWDPVVRCLPGGLTSGGQVGEGWCIYIYIPWNPKWRFGRWFSSSIGWFYRLHVSSQGCI